MSVTPANFMKAFPTSYELTCHCSRREAAVDGVDFYRIAVVGGT
jgi:hypothetical protein